HGPVPSARGGLGGRVPSGGARGPARRLPRTEPLRPALHDAVQGQPAPVRPTRSAPPAPSRRAARGRGAARPVRRLARPGTRGGGPRLPDEASVGSRGRDAFPAEGPRGGRRRAVSRLRPFRPLSPSV